MDSYPGDYPRPASRVRVLSKLLILGLLALVVVMGVRLVSLQRALQMMSVGSDQLAGEQQQRQNQEIARRIVEKVRRMYDLPSGEEPTVATIVDVETLRKRNSFYNKAQNGDFLIVTSTRAVLYDEDRNIILDVIPVQIEPAAPAAGASQQNPAGQK
jgi:cell division protein FtsB